MSFYEKENISKSDILPWKNTRFLPKKFQHWIIAIFFWMKEPKTLFRKYMSFHGKCHLNWLRVSSLLNSSAISPNYHNFLCPKYIWCITTVLEPVYSRIFGRNLFLP